MEQIQIRLLTLMSWILLPIFAVIIGALIFFAVRNIIRHKVTIPQLLFAAIISGGIYLAFKWAIGIPDTSIPAGLRGILVSAPYVFPLGYFIGYCLIIPTLDKTKEVE